MSGRIEHAGLQVDQELSKFLEQEVLPDTGISAATFWSGLASMVNDLAPRNRALLAKRDDLQAKLDTWYKANRNYTMADYQAYLREIGYLLPEGADFQVTTANVDNEITTLAGPQLVVPVMNARYALNAANARWGSLYDALYGTDAISEADGAEKGKAYNPVRGAKVITWAKNFLDEATPLQDARWDQVSGFIIANGKLSHHD